MSKFSKIPLPIVQLMMTSSSVLLVDQFSKMLAEQRGSVVINSGISFGLGTSVNQGVMPIALVGVLIVAMYVLRHTWQRQPQVVGLFFGGAISNVMDRFIYGGVRDWLPLPIGGLHNNLADYAVVVSLLTLFFAHLRSTLPSHPQQ